MEEQKKRLELEPAVEISGRVLIPIAWTMGRPRMRGHFLSIAMCREALGVVVRDGDGTRVLLCDGRTMSIDELVAACPSLNDVLAALA